VSLPDWRFSKAIVVTTAPDIVQAAIVDEDSDDYGKIITVVPKGTEYVPAAEQLPVSDDSSQRFRELEACHHQIKDDPSCPNLSISFPKTSKGF